MTAMMKIDCDEAEIEPKPAPADVYMTNQMKVRVRMRPIKLAKKESKWSVPRGLLKKKSLRSNPNLHISPMRHGKQKHGSDSSLNGYDINHHQHNQQNVSNVHHNAAEATAKSKRNNRFSQFVSQKHMTVMDFNSYPDVASRRSMINEGSDLFNGSFSLRESKYRARGRSKDSPEQKIEPVHLRDLSEYVSSASQDLEISDDEWSEVAHKKKKTIRARRKNKGEDDDQKLKIRAVAMTHEKKHTTGAQYYKDSDVDLAQQLTLQ